MFKSHIVYAALSVFFLGAVAAPVSHYTFMWVTADADAGMHDHAGMQMADFDGDGVSEVMVACDYDSLFATFASTAPAAPTSLNTERPSTDLPASASCFAGTADVSTLHLRGPPAIDLFAAVG